VQKIEDFRISIYYKTCDMKVIENFGNAYTNGLLPGVDLTDEVVYFNGGLGCIIKEIPKGFQL